MTYDMTPAPSRRPRGDVLLSRADLAAAMHELESLRGTVLEDAAVERIKIAQLERLIASATVVDVDAAGDGAGLGSVVRVKDHRDREVEYELVGRLSANAVRAQVSPASPVGAALLGARSGDVVRVSLPNGRARTLTVVAVRRPTASRFDADPRPADGHGSTSPRRMA